MHGAVSLGTLLGVLAIAVGRPQVSDIYFPDDSDPGKEAGTYRIPPEPSSTSTTFTTEAARSEPPSSSVPPEPNSTSTTFTTEAARSEPPSPSVPPEPSSTSTTSTTEAAISTPSTTRIPPGSPSQIVFYVSCPCPFTRQYSPVCGTDGRIYGNMGVLQCAKRCGTQVDLYLVGACGFNNG